MAKEPGTHLSSTTQDYLDILDITNDLVILKDGSASMVMQVSAINFGLLSEPEQDAIIYAYAALINSLSFPIQILIKSQPKDVTNYLRYIDEQLVQAPNQMRREQIASYRQFVSNLITEQNVLDKNFYVVLPLSALELGLVSAANPLSSVTPKKATPKIDKRYVIEKSLNILLPRKDHMINQFGRLGLKATPLNTKDLIHLFYSSYNPTASEGAKIVETREYTSAVVAAQGVSPINFSQNITNTPESETPAPAKPQPAAPTAQPTSPNPAAAAAPNQPAPPPSPAPSTNTPATDQLTAAAAAVPREGPR